ncbi:MAG: SDR family oxidoreductase [Ectothiorhodospiraceae bacterium]|jgi:3-oxoacyl-[acyl-carrier protein] reductase
MDMGIGGRKAIVCGASRGLGRACAEALAEEGVGVTIAARDAERLNGTAEAIRRATGSPVEAIAADVTTAEGREAVLAACPKPDILVTNAGGPPPGDFRDFSEEDWIAAVRANMLAPIELIRASVDGMIQRGFGRIVNITSGAVKAPIPELCLSNGARTGLTGFVAGLSRQTVRHNVTINNLLPGPFDTDRLAGMFAAAAERTGRDVDDIRAERAAENPAGRFGRPDEFGRYCAFVCSVHAGYITGQNLLMDGGAYPGTL